MRVLFASVIAMVFVLASAVLLWRAAMREFFPSAAAGSTVAALETADGAIGPATRRQGTTPSEVATNEARRTQYPGLLGPPSSRPGVDSVTHLQRAPAVTDLEKLAESYRRKLQGLQLDLAGAAGRLIGVHNEMRDAVRNWKLEKERFDYDLSVRHRNPLLDLPTPNQPRLPPSGVLEGFRRELVAFETAVVGYVKDCKEEEYSFWRQTAGVRRIEEVERDWLSEALELPEVNEAFFISHARQPLAKAFAELAVELRGQDRDYLAGVAPPAFTFGCVARINALRFEADSAYTPCFVDAALLAVAQDHAAMMATREEIDPEFLSSPVMGGVPARRARETLSAAGIDPSAVSVFCVSNEDMPGHPAWIVDYVVAKEGRSAIVTGQDIVGVGACRSEQGRCYISFLMARR